MARKAQIRFFSSDPAMKSPEELPLGFPLNVYTERGKTLSTLCFSGMRCSGISREQVTQTEVSVSTQEAVVAWIGVEVGEDKGK